MRIASLASERGRTASSAPARTAEAGAAESCRVSGRLYRVARASPSFTRRPASTKCLSQNCKVRGAGFGVSIPAISARLAPSGRCSRTARTAVRSSSSMGLGNWHSFFLIARRPQSRNQNHNRAMKTVYAQSQAARKQSHEANLEILRRTQPQNCRSLSHTHQPSLASTRISFQVLGELPKILHFDYATRLQIDYSEFVRTFSSIRP